MHVHALTQDTCGLCRFMPLRPLAPSLGVLVPAHWICCEGGCGQKAKDAVVQGLRTLVLASRVLPEEEYAAWALDYREAAGSLDDREARIAAVRSQHDAPGFVKRVKVLSGRRASRRCAPSMMPWPDEGGKSLV